MIAKRPWRLPRDIFIPGWVDIHTHYDGQMTWDERRTPSSTLGATTVLAGNCGVGFAPARPADHETLIRNGALVDGVRLLRTARGYRATMRSGVVTFENDAWTGETPGQPARREREVSA